MANLWVPTDTCLDMQNIKSVWIFNKQFIFKSHAHTQTHIHIILVQSESTLLRERNLIPPCDLENTIVFPWTDFFFKLKVLFSFNWLDGFEVFLHLSSHVSPSVHCYKFTLLWLIKKKVMKKLFCLRPTARIS